MKNDSILQYIMLLLLGIATGFFAVWLRRIWKSFTE